MNPPHVPSPEEHAAAAKAANDNSPDAADYIEAGLHLIAVHGVDANGRCTCGKYPCGRDNRNAGKHPPAKGWHKFVAECVMPGYNHGLAMGVQPSGARLLALDDDGGLAALEATLGALPPTLTSRTPSGGSHRVFVVPEGPRFKNTVRVAGHDVDVRCDGGYIVAAPSKTPAGEYAWTVLTDPAPLPDAWLRALSGEAPSATIDFSALDDPKLLDERAPKCPAGADPVDVAREWLTRAPKAIEGRAGHSALFDRACELIAGYSLDRDTADALLREYYNPRCVPPFDPESSEWAHKLDEAEQCQREAGYLLATAEPEPAKQASPAGAFDGWNFLPADYDPANQPPVEFVCKPLDIVRGELTTIAGYGNCGKTTLCMALALCGAFDKPLFGMMPVRHGRVVHLSYELGRTLLGDKYMRLARHWGISSGSIFGCIRLAEHPRANLTHRGFEEALSVELEGAALCILDSLTAAAPGIDQNSADFGQVCYTLQRVANRTGCAIVLIHHANKSGEGARAFSGHSTVFAACRTGLLVSRDHGADVSELAGVKSSTRALSDLDTRFHFVDHASGALSVELDYRAPDAEMLDRLRAWFKEQPERTAKNRKAISEGPGHCPGKAQKVREAVRALEERHELIVHADGSVTYVERTSRFFGGPSS